MFLRSICIASVLLPALACATPARADNIVTRICYAIHRDWKRNNCWPKPFVCPDRQSVRAPFVTMVAKGWQRQNTLGDHHFEVDTGQLNRTGQLKVRWILTQAPAAHRSIYVHRAIDPAQTTTRIDAVQQLAIRILPKGQLPAVMETHLPAPGWSAEQMDAIGRRYQATIPDPRLPKVEDSGT